MWLIEKRKERKEEREEGSDRFFDESRGEKRNDTI